MGIPFLNRLLRSECKNAVQMISLSDLSGKKIAVDTSIYLYKYLVNDNLIENFYLMLSLFRHYNIIPVFIFDGKPPAEKKELLIQRIKDKKTAQEEYDKLKELLNTNALADEEEKQEVLTNMDVLKKKFISIHKTHIETVKQLIVSYGASYYDAPGEADTLCAKLVLTNKVWACLSEDMDMFVYGTSRVIRYLSLLNHTAVLYNMESILKTLNVNQEEFKEICVLSGTDYNIHKDIHKDIHKGKKEEVSSQPQIYKILNSFREYQQDKVDTDTQ
jgi:flap endonuclease-1